MVTDDRMGMDRLEKDLQFLLKNPLKFGWLANPSPQSKGKGRGTSKKLNDDGSKSSENVATVARAHELSLGNLKSVQPPRSVLIAVSTENTVQIEADIAAFIGPVIEGAIKARDGMALLGESVVDMAKRRYQMQKGWKPLSDKRKAQKIRGGKSGNKARLNFGQEVNSLRYKIGGK